MSLTKKPYEVRPAVLRPADAMRKLNCSAKKLYELINANEIKSYREGAARKILDSSIDDYIERKTEEERRRRSAGGESNAPREAP